MSRISTIYARFWNLTPCKRFPVAGSVQGPADLWDDGVLRPRDAQVRDDDEHPRGRGHHLRREKGSSIPVKGFSFMYMGLDLIDWSFYFLSIFYTTTEYGGVFS